MLNARRETLAIAGCCQRRPPVVISRFKHSIGVRGFTMVELLVAIIIFAVIMLFGLTFFSFSSNSFGNAKETTFAISCANSEMERMKTVVWGQVKTSSMTVTDAQTGIQYSVHRQVQSQPIGGTEYRIITIAVTWPGQKSPVSIVSVRAEN